MPNPPPPLEYQPDPGGIRRRSRWLRLPRRYVVLLLVAAVGVAAYLGGRTVADHARLLHWQRRCMTWSPPAGMVARELDATRAARLIASGDYAPAPFQPVPGGLARGLGVVPATTPAGPAAYFDPAFLKRFRALARAEDDRTSSMTLEARFNCYDFGVGPVFLHARSTPAGRRRLVVVEVGEIAGDTDPRDRLAYAVFEPARLFSRARRVDPARDQTFNQGGSASVIGIGRPDPVDPTKFSIPYSLRGRAGTIDGRLNDDETVTFTLRRP